MNTGAEGVRERLKPTEPAGDGFEWAVAEEGPDWGPAADGSTCRAPGPAPVGGRPHAHGAPASVSLVRGLSRRVRWNYCVPEHSYGRWLEDGKVMHWIRRKAEPGGA